MAVSTYTSDWRSRSKSQLLDDLQIVIGQRDKVITERDTLAAAIDRVRRRHPSGDEEAGALSPGLWCPGCGQPRTRNGWGVCPDRAALAEPSTSPGSQGGAS